MQQTVTLIDQEVTEAIIDYASKHGVKFEGMKAEVSVIAGRKENGTYATIDLKPKLTKQDEINSFVVSNKEFESVAHETVEITEEAEQSFSEDEPDDEEELFS